LISRANFCSLQDGGQNLTHAIDVRRSANHFLNLKLRATFLNGSLTSVVSGEQSLRMAATALSLALISGFGNHKENPGGAYRNMRTAMENLAREEVMRETAFSLGILAFVLALQ